MKRLIMGLGLAVGFAGAAAAQAIGGEYVVGGTNFDGSAYSGTAGITQAGSTCRIVWHVGGATSEGMCMTANKTLAAFYRLGSEYGMAVYELQPDG